MDNETDPIAKEIHGEKKNPVWGCFVSEVIISFALEIWLETEN